MATAKKYLIKSFLLILVMTIALQPAFAVKKKKKSKPKPKTVVSVIKRDSVFKKPFPFDLDGTSGNTGSKDADDIIWFAKQQLGIPYKYASANPKNGGLDCSGFLYYVFTHFSIQVPRSSSDYMNFGTPVDKKWAKKGDVIVFTGSNANDKTGGHVGIILENNDGLISFIHGSSGKANGVTISYLSEKYYSERFLKIVRILN